MILIAVGEKDFITKTSAHRRSGVVLLLLLLTFASLIVLAPQAQATHQALPGSLQQTPLTQEQPPPTGNFTWEFFDFETQQVVNELPFGRSVELILASQATDVRRFLPITFEIVIDGETVFSQTAADPISQCRGPTGCSVTGPPVPLGSTGEIIARDANGNVISTFPFTSEPTSDVTQEGTTTRTQERTTTREREPCWWCWGLKLLLFASLLCVLFVFIVKEKWWDWCFEWFILIFIWIPFILAWVRFFNPWWWWIPVWFLWIPAIYLGARYWGVRKAWWKPWWWWVGGLWVVLILGGAIYYYTASLAAPWWYLLPVYWLPWVGIYVLGRGITRPWWRPWMWLLFGGFVVWVFTWFIWLGTGWAWVIPFLILPLAPLWFWWTKQWSWSIAGPKLCFALPWWLFPWLVWGNLFWDMWWCYVILGFFIAHMLCVLFTWVRKFDWYEDWTLFFILIFIWVPFLFGRLFFAPWWWRWALIAWLPVIFAVGWWWGQKRSWWKPWMWGVLGGWSLVLLFLALVLRFPRWWYLAFFWLPWVGFYIWYRGRLSPWWKPWMWGAFAAYVGWWFFWAWWLWPTWWWIVPIAVLPVLAWWFFDTGQTTYDIVGPKLCFLLPWLYVPAFAYGFYVYCIYWYSYQTF